MKFTQTTPCKECPFLKSMKNGFTLNRLKEFAGNGLFPCHKSATLTDDSEEGYGGDFVANESSVVCAGMLIFNEKRKQPNQMMRICERIGKYNYKNLNMKAPIR